MIRESINDAPNIEIDSFSGLLIDFARLNNKSHNKRFKSRVGFRIRASNGTYEQKIG